MAGVAVQKPRSQVRPALHPVAAKSLSVALWKVPAVAPGHGVPAGNQSAVRVTSLKEAVPRRKVDVQNTMQSVRGFGIITRNGAIRRYLAFLLFHSQKAATLPGVAAFGFLGPLENENVQHRSPLLAA